MRKKIITIVIAIVALIFILNKLSLLFIRKGNGYGTDVLNFYKQPKNSIDIIFLGSSHAYSSFNPYLIEQDTGLKGYCFSTQQQPLWITYYYLQEALKYQKPKYVVLEVHMAVVGNNDYAEESVNREAIDKMRMSVNKINAINVSVEDKSDRISYYFNIIKYHSRYKELNKQDFLTAFCDNTVDNKGYIALPKNQHVFDQIQCNSNETKKITDKNEEYLKKIISLAKSNNINLILVKTPCQYGEDYYEKLNYINEIAEKEEVPFYNYVKNIESINLDFDNDFFDNGHLNMYGSEKFTNKFIIDANLKNNQ